MMKSICAHCKKSITVIDTESATNVIFEGDRMFCSIKCYKGVGERLKRPINVVNVLVKMYDKIKGK